MVSILFTIGGVVMNALVFRGTNFCFSKLTDHGEKERRRHNLLHEMRYMARDE